MKFEQYSPIILSQPKGKLGGKCLGIWTKVTVRKVVLFFSMLTFICSFIYQRITYYWIFVTYRALSKESLKSKFFYILPEAWWWQPVKFQLMASFSKALTLRYLSCFVFFFLIWKELCEYRSFTPVFSCSVLLFFLNLEKARERKLTFEWLFLPQESC